MTTKIDTKSLLDAITPHLENIYPGQHDALARAIVERVQQFTPFASDEPADRWTEKDVLLITYGDSITRDDEKPLETLHDFLARHLEDVFSHVHILPFFPYSSDDGFSVIDYRAVNPELGGWEHITQIADRFRLMVDLVINHTSRENLWFYDFVANIEPARDFFIKLPPDTDTSMVTRPRNTPLLVPVNTHRGTQHVWATFSEDQIDLDFGNPAVLLEFVDIFLYYIANGARLIRLDAIAFLWKRLGTSCIHLDETHEVVKLLRDIIDHVASDCILITETNVPHEENISYFGDGDEAHMVYQFSLPPLVLHALHKGTSVHLARWAGELPELHNHCTYLNFTASHDGIGLRALEGILPDHEKESLIESMHKFGGFVSMKANPDGTDTPYEINISLFDALQGTRRGTDQWQVQRFICSQAILLGMQGLPALYIHSILATPNDLHGVELSGRTRSINRKKWSHDELHNLLQSTNTPNHEVFHELKRIIRVRTAEPCFHPENPQQVLDAGNGVFAFTREDRQSGRLLLTLYNVTPVPQAITIKDQPSLTDHTNWHDLVSDTDIDTILPFVKLQPYQFMWLVEN